jgi:hypothetical protein
VSTWLDDQIAKNLSWRAEEILNEIHGVHPEPVEDVPDTNLSLAQVASAVMTGHLGVELERVWRIG